jgi:CHAT domain-containing protein
MNLFWSRAHRQLGRAIVVAIVAAVVVGGTWWYARHSDGDPFRTDRQALVAAVGTGRAIDARITGGFAYGPLRTPTRGGAPPSANLSLLAVAGAVLKRVETGPISTDLWTLGVTNVLLGRYDAAVRDLDDALAALPPNAQLYSDSASARLARAGSDGKVEDLARAVDAAERALAIDSALLEARFNKAVALERLGLTDEAIEAWSEYLAADQQSGWAIESRERLTQLRAHANESSPCLEMRASTPARLVESVAQCPQESREYAESLLGEWAAATLDHRPDLAAAKVVVIKRISASLEAHNGDRLLADTVRGIERSRGTVLARGLRALEDGRTFYNADRRDEATARLVEAKSLLRSVASPYWLWAQHWLATIHTHGRELGKALGLLAETESIAIAKGYLSVQARTAWLMGVATLQLSDPARAIEHYHEAASIYERLGEAGNVSNVMNAAADSERILGDAARGWRSLSTALRHLGDVADPTRRYLAYYNAALFSHREGLEFAALHYQRSALGVARARTGPVGVIEASINYAGILGRLGRITEADALLRDSSDRASQLTNAPPRAYMLARIAATRGEVLLDRQPQDAVGQLDAALQHFTRVEPSETPRLLLLKGRALSRAGDEARATAAFAEGIATFEDRLRRLRDTPQRVSYSDEGWDLYTDLVEQRLKHNQLDDALMIADRGRSRAMAPRDVPIEEERLRRSLPDDTALVYYVELQRDLHAWVITRVGTRHHRIPIDANGLQLRASRISRAIASRASTAPLDDALGELYDAVIEPLRLPAQIRRIVFFPDGALRLVPFAALRNHRGRFLVEDTAVIVADSLSSLHSNLTTPTTTSYQPGRNVLVIAEPLPDVKRWPELAPLPFAGREGATVATQYENSVLLARENATKAHLLARLPAADVVHFAGHAVANQDFPELSRLVLTPSAGDPGELLARDLNDARLKTGAIVVLSACETGFGPVRRAAGIQSLAKAFLAMGAESVIAASWPVEDLATSELMINFHQQLSRGTAAADALRAAQLAAIAARKPVSLWAGFTVFGTGLSREWRRE